MPAASLQVTIKTNLLAELKRSSPKPAKRPIFCHRRGIEIFSRLFSTQQRPKCVCIRRLAGARLLTGSFENSVTRGWVEAPNGRAPFSFHGAVVGFVDRCRSRTQNLAASNKHLAELFSGRSWPKIGPGTIFFGVFEKFETFFSKICAHSERYRNLLAGISEILTFYGNIAFPLSPV